MSDIRTGGWLTWENAGPVTATWSAPESCATSRGLIHRGPANPPFNSSITINVGKCGEYDAIAECVPNGDKVDEIYKGVDRGVMPIVSHYYSPASVCPQGWASVGHAAVNNGTATSTGIFAPTVFYDGSPSTTLDFPYANWIANMFTTVLEPTETAIACCPSGFTADMYAGCYSNFPLVDLAGSTACRVRYLPTGDNNDWRNSPVATETWSYDGTTTTEAIRAGPFTSGWRDSDEAHTESVPFNSEGYPEATGTQGGYGSDYFVQAVAVAQPLFLINDGSGSSEESAAPSETESEASATPSESGTEESAARALAPSGWGMVGGIMAAWGVSMLAGVGLLAAW
ncbi:hypothetical protein F5X68DRAFT_272813 [Plectosphaerella plurivora]|uniref:Uncharacterized protein n=1 Tax=Plectosphaerella plurivora TaxID=936078 RepID=A0A9P9AGD2_9PEZI|nr:hypothetical protein F5X68DRAFT_272813 [Plectosphaerella plurivora]